MTDTASHKKARHAIAGACCVAVIILVAAIAFAVLPWQQIARGQHERIAPKTHMSAYTWRELSSIARDISSCTSLGEAEERACSYGLCNKDGSIASTAVKRVVFTNGASVDARLVGIWHDTAASGGKVALSFAFAQALGPQPMNHMFEDPQGRNADSIGGWSASDMRAWLNGTLYYQLPLELRNAIVSAEKSTASLPQADDETTVPGHLQGSSADWTQVTCDKLWLFSATEICGEIPANPDLDIDESMVPVYESEGEQYRLFADAGARAFEPCDALVMHMASGNESDTCSWWLRSKTLEFGEGFWLIGTDGAALNGIGESAAALAGDTEPSSWGPDHARGVIAGFCL